jgi:hypothetical protein
VDCATIAFSEHMRTLTCCTHCVHCLATGLLVYQYLLIYLLLCLIFSDRLIFFKTTYEGCSFRINVRVQIVPMLICSEVYHTWYLYRTFS